MNTNCQHPGPFDLPKKRSACPSAPSHRPSPPAGKRVPPRRERGQLTRRLFLGTTAGALALPWLRLTGAEQTPAETVAQRIAAALPERAFARPRKPRRLLIFELNVNYGGHGSIPTASAAFTQMGHKLGVFETVISKDPAVFQAESLRQFDAVFFNNNVGNLFTDAGLRQNLVDFIYGGGGMMGVHGTSVAFTQWPGAVEDWPEFGLMIGARGANHRASDERVVIKLDDPAHPLVAPFGGQGFEYRDEFFRVHEPYSRSRVRVLLSFDNEKTDLNQGPAYGRLVRADNDYAIAWVRQYGRGRSFYCTIAHNPYVFWDPKMLQFYLAAAQFILGDLDAPTTPSAKLTPAIRAQEKLGWRVGLVPAPDGNQPLFATIDAAAQAGLLHLSGAARQPVSAELRKPLDEALDREERRQIRFKLDAAGARWLVWQLEQLPAEDQAARRRLQFARQMGVEAVAAPLPLRLDTVEKWADEFDLKFAFTADRLSPTAFLQQCAGRSPRLGMRGDVGQWLAARMDPVRAVQTLKERLITLEFPAGYPKVDAVLAEVRRLKLQPVLIGVVAGPRQAETLQAIEQASLREG